MIYIEERCNIYHDGRWNNSLYIRKDSVMLWYSFIFYIENNSKVLIGLERWMKSSYLFGSNPNLELWHHHRILKTHIRHYDVICSYIENTYTTLWRHTNLCCLCQMQNKNGLCQNSKYKWFLQGKGSQIWINNKTILEFGSRRIWEIIRASVCVIYNTNLCLNNSSYPTRPHSIIA